MAITTSENFSDITPNDMWHLLRAYFHEIGLVRQHLDSFNVFLEETLQQIVDETKRIVPDIPIYRCKEMLVWFLEVICNSIQDYCLSVVPGAYDRNVLRLSLLEVTTYLFKLNLAA